MIHSIIMNDTHFCCCILNVNIKCNFFPKFLCHFIELKNYKKRISYIKKYGEKNLHHIF